MEKEGTIILTLTFLLTEAQTDKEYIDFVKSTVKLEVKSYVYSVLKLSNKEMQKFDPLFNNYLKQYGKNEVKKMNLFDDYFNGFTTMSDKQLNVLNKKVLKTDFNTSKIYKKFYKKFKRVLGVNKTTTFFFLKKSIDNLVEGSRLEALNN